MAEAITRHIVRLAENAVILQRVAIYGVALAVGATGLAWVDYQRVARTHFANVGIALIALAFLALGIFVGRKIGRVPPPSDFDGNPKVCATLGISQRELAVLDQLSAGRSTKEISAALHISPNTVKTHVARLFDKLEAKRRTDAIRRARELGIIR